ncbi:hypothetical protein K488DRAFT_76983 [Vararia minispora EC-137]|uniref:Uncharacterized protein n=1 Tax=Vararia minispora EC-137 TaxID=1314806 RepID=A0ACB8QU11_9AGAM|nr:hypothetical protein K488DRAFT_76983 [Vararia minispora EC-137]
MPIENTFVQLVPRLDQRVPLTSSTIVYTLIPAPLLLILACLARTPETHALRLALLPIVLLSLFHAAYGYVWLEEDMHMSNTAFLSLAMVAKSLDLSLPCCMALKVSERTKVECDVKGAAHVTTPAPPLTWAWLTDSISLLLSARGYGWEYGRGTHKPSYSHPCSRVGYTFAMLSSIVTNFALLDLSNTFIHLFPGLSQLPGGTIFRVDLPPLQRYVASTYVTFLTGVAGYAVIEMLYDIVALSAVLLLQHVPASWPPVMDRPWAAQSLREFWTRWHQLARRIFLVFGGIPGGWIGGNVGRVLGGFAASGVFHECAMWPLGQGWDWRQPAVFAAMGVLVVGEGVWTRVTGRKVGGFWGRVWAWAVLVTLPQGLIDAWYLKGIGSAGRAIQDISPTAKYIIPAVQHLLKLG